MGKWLKERLLLLPIWALLFSAFIVMVLYGPNRQDYYSSQHNQNTATQSQAGTGIPSTITNVEKTPSADNGSEEPDWQTRDNKAQIQMMRAAWVAVGMTGIGLIMIGFTLGYTRRAAISTSDTLGITQDDVDNSKRATRAELQPYLDAILIEKPLVIIGIEEDCLEVAVSGKIKITNKGKTPAIHLFGNVGFVVNTMIARGEVGKVGYSGATESKSGCFSRLGRSMLGSDEDFEFPITFRCRFPKELFYGVNEIPTPERVRVGLGLRLSFADHFIGPEKINGRYGRRVMEYEFGGDVTREDVEPVPFLREVKPKAIDYPEEHNRLEPFIPHAYYSSGALDMIKMRAPKSNT